MMNQDQRYGLKFRLLLALGSFVVTAAIAIIILILSGTWPGRLDTRPQKPIAGPLGNLFRQDPRYGWSMNPSFSATHESQDFKVTYTINADGYRVTPALAGKSEGTLLCLGGSFTFGHGVGDAEPWPAQLGTHITNHKVINGAVMAWGPTQAYLYLEHYLQQKQKPKLIVYGWIDHHMLRNTPNRHWIELQGPKKRHPILGTPSEQHPILGKKGDRLALKYLAGFADIQTETDDKSVTLAIMKAISQLCQDYQVPLLLIHIPSPAKFRFIEPGESLPDLQSEFKDLGITVLDLRDAPGGVFPNDPHPTPELHKNIAVRLAEYISKNKMLEPGP